MRRSARALLAMCGATLAAAHAVAADAPSKAKVASETAKADKANTPNPDGSAATPQQRVLYEVKDTQGVFKFDFGVPTSPAMTLLGLSSDTTPPSTSLTELVVALPTLYGSEAGQSVAVDFPAARLFESRFNSTYDTYIRAPDWYRIGYRTRLGLAAISGNDGGGDASKQVRSRLAFGLSASLLDSSDPLRVRNAKGGLLLDSCLAPLTLISQPILDKGVGQVASDTTEVGDKLEGVRDLIDAYVRHKAFTDDERKAARIAIGLDDAAPAPAAEAPVVTHPEAKADPKRARIEGLLAEAEARKADPSLIAAIRLMLDDAAPAPTDHPAAPAKSDPAPVKVAADKPDMDDPQLFAALKGQEAKLSAQLDLAHNKGGTSIDDALKAAGVTAAVQRCNESAARMARFAPDLDVGLGVLAQGAPGKLKDLKADGKVFWLAYKHPLGTPVFEDEYGAATLSPLPSSAWLIALAARASWDERLVTKDKTTPEFRADTLNAWIGLERLTPGYRLTAQYGWLKVRASDAIGKPFEKSGERYLVGGQFRLREDSPLWLGLTYGNGYGTVGELKANTALVTLSYSSPGPPDITK